MAKPENKGKLADRIFWVVILISLLAVVVLFCRQRYYKDKIVVYELTWQAEDKDGKVVFNRWVYFIQYRTKLPVRIDKYSTADPNIGYALKEVLMIEYPTDEQIKQTEHGRDYLKSKI